MTRATLALSLALVACGGATTTTTSTTPPTRQAAAGVPSETATPAVRCSDATASGGSLAGVWIRGSDREATCRAIAAKAGAPLDEAIVDQDVRNLFRSALFDDVVAVVETDRTGTRLVYEVTERAPVERIDVVGEPSGANLKDRVDIKLAFVDPAVLHRAAAQIADALRVDGYRGVKVVPEVRPGRAPAKVVQFVITPGARTVLGKVSFVGLTGSRETAVRKQLSVVASEPISNEAAERDSLAVQMALYEEGLLASKLTYQLVEVAGSPTVDLVFEVTEGPVFKLGTVRVKGARARDAKAYTKALAKVRRGDVARRSTMVAAREAIEAVHAGDTPAVTVLPETKVDTDKRVLDLDYVIE